MYFQQRPGTSVLMLVLLLIAACSSQPTPAPSEPAYPSGTLHSSVATLTSANGEKAQITKDLIHQVESDFDLANEPKPRIDTMGTCMVKVQNNAQRAIVNLLSSPASQNFGLEVLQTIVAEGAGEKVKIQLFESEPNALLVVVYPGFCAAHRFRPSREYYVFDRTRNIMNHIGWAGPFDPKVYPVPNGWVVNAPMGSENDYGLFSVWHIRQEETEWAKQVVFEYYTGSVELVDEYQQLMIHQYFLTHTSSRPCQFRPEVEAIINHVNYHNGERIYEWEDGKYEFRHDTHDASVYLDGNKTPRSISLGPAGLLEAWQDYCITATFTSAPN